MTELSCQKCLTLKIRLHSTCSKIHITTIGSKHTLTEPIFLYGSSLVDIILSWTGNSTSRLSLLVGSSAFLKSKHDL